MPTQRLRTAAVMSTAAALFIVIVQQLLPDPLNNRLFDTAHAAFGFSIQNVMWIFFFVTLGELWLRLRAAQQIERGFAKQYLPEDHHTVLELGDMAAIIRRIEADSAVPGSAAAFIRKLVMQFQTSRSIEQTQNMLSAQLEMQGSLIDTRYTMIRYLTWLIPTLGFIGTVVGIANALNYAGEVNGEGERFVAELTARLAVAFDTTFVALVMSAVLVFLTQVIQGREERSLVLIGQYCLDHLINRLYIPQGGTHAPL